MMNRLLRWRTLGVACTAALVLASTLPAEAASSRTTRHATEKGTVTVTEIVRGLKRPWALAFLPDGAGMLVTERPGRLRHVSPQGEIGPPITGTPAVFARGQGGLLDIALAPDFAHSRVVYLAFSEAGPNELAGTAIGRGRLSADLRHLENFEVIFRQEPKRSTGVHFGARMAFGPDGHLYVALGENNQRPFAQDLDKHQGKIVRLTPDGEVPPDNPFVGRSDARPEIWSYGHRNPQGLAWHPQTGELWEHEHGPRGGDEINIIRAGSNYGWPRATHGINYTGLPIPEAEARSLPGMEDPVYVWSQSPAISGMTFYTGERAPGWKSNLFVGALKNRELIRLELHGNRVVHEERLLKALGERIRDVRAGPDGALYLLTDENDGALLRVELDPSN